MQEHQRVSPGLPNEFREMQEILQAKWDKWFERYPPLPTITRSLIPSPKHPNPLHLAYGYAFPDDCLMKYAEHHQLQMPVGDLLAATSRKETVTYGALTKDEEHLREYLELASRLAVHRDLERRAGIELLNVRPLVDHFGSMFALYTNYDLSEPVKYDRKEYFAAMDAIEDAFKECGVKPVPLWWYDLDHLPPELLTMSA